MGITTEHPVRIQRVVTDREARIVIELTHGAINVFEYGDEIMVTVTVRAGATIDARARGTLHILPPETGSE